MLISGLSMASYAQDQTPGEMTFSVRTVTYYGDRSPKHVLVIWVEDSNGFIKTRELNGDRRKEWLLTWRASSNYNVVDATTGATLTSHTSHTVKWNCKDITGNIVPDGEYTVFIEFTEEHAQGPIYSIKFNKGTESVTLNPFDQDYFKNMSLTFEPLTVTAGFDFTINGMDVAFNNTSTGADSYFWDFGDGKTTAQTNPTHTYDTAGTYTVSLKASTGSLNDTHAEEITITAPEVAAGFSYVAEGLSVSFTNTSANADTYLWDFGDGNTGSEEDPVHAYGSEGTYTVSLKASTGSLSDTHTEDITIAAPEVTAGFSFIANGLSVSFINSSANADTYAWDFGDGNTSAEANPVHIYGSEGTYTVILEASNTGNSASVQQDVTVIDPTVGIVPFRNGISVYPNPTGGRVIIDPAEGMTIQSVKLISLDGRILIYRLILQSGTVEIDMSNLNTGIYVMQLESFGQVTRQFIIRE